MKPRGSLPGVPALTSFIREFSSYRYQAPLAIVSPDAPRQIPSLRFKKPWTPSTAHPLVTAPPPASPGASRNRPSGRSPTNCCTGERIRSSWVSPSPEHADHHGLVVLKTPQRVGHPGKLAHRVPGLEHGSSDPLQAYTLAHAASSCIAPPHSAMTRVRKEACHMRFRRDALDQRLPAPTGEPVTTSPAPTPPAARARRGHCSPCRSP